MPFRTAGVRWKFFSLNDLQRLDGILDHLVLGDKYIRSGVEKYEIISLYQRNFK